jgi:hypothetical protein
LSVLIREVEEVEDGWVRDGKRLMKGEEFIG